MSLDKELLDGNKRPAATIQVTSMVNKTTHGLRAQKTLCYTHG